MAANEEGWNWVLDTNTLPPEWRSRGAVMLRRVNEKGNSYGQSLVFDDRDEFLRALRTMLAHPYAPPMREDNPLEHP